MVPIIGLGDIYIAVCVLLTKFRRYIIEKLVFRTLSNEEVEHKEITIKSAEIMTKL